MVEGDHHLRRPQPYIHTFSSDNGSSPIRCQAIIYTNADLL